MSEGCFTCLCWQYRPGGVLHIAQASMQVHGLFVAHIHPLYYPSSHGVVDSEQFHLGLCRDPVFHAAGVGTTAMSCLVFRLSSRPKRCGSGTGWISVLVSPLQLSCAASCSLSTSACIWRQVQMVLWALGTLAVCNRHAAVSLPVAASCTSASKEQ